MTVSSLETDKPKVAIIDGKMIDLEMYKGLRDFQFSHTDALAGAEVKITQIEDFK